MWLVTHHTLALDNVMPWCQFHDAITTINAQRRSADVAWWHGEEVSGPGMPEWRMVETSSGQPHMAATRSGA